MFSTLQKSQLRRASKASMSANGKSVDRVVNLLYSSRLDKSSFVLRSQFSELKCGRTLLDAVQSRERQPSATRRSDEFAARSAQRRQSLDDVVVLPAPVVASSRITFCVFVGEHDAFVARAPRDVCGG